MPTETATTLLHSVLGLNFRIEVLARWMLDTRGSRDHVRYTNEHINGALVHKVGLSALTQVDDHGLSDGACRAVTTLTDRSSLLAVWQGKFLGLACDVHS